MPLFQISLLQVFDDFPNISDHFQKISEDSSKLVQRSDERCRTFPKNTRIFPKIAKDFRGRPEDVSIIHNKLKYNLRDKLDIS